MTTTTRLERLARSPLLHCLALGLAAAWGLALAAPPPLLEPDEAQLREAVRNWTRLSGRSPGERELAQLVAEVVDDEVLYREALARHFERLPAVRDRLARLGAFLELAPAEAPAELREREAIALGLERSDPIVRRYMLGALRERLAAELAVAPPTRAEIEAAYRAAPERFAVPGSVAFRHVFVGGLDEAARARAAALASGLRAERLDPADAIRRGDAFYDGHETPLFTLPKLEQRFGNGFAAAVARLEPAAWSEPIPSAYGYHIVWKTAESPPSLRPLAEVEAVIGRELQRERVEAGLARKLADLRARYRIVVPGAFRPSAATGEVPRGRPAADVNPAESQR